jgi:hypothetical protein
MPALNDFRELRVTLFLTFHKRNFKTKKSFQSDRKTPRTSVPSRSNGKRKLGPVILESSMDDSEIVSETPEKNLAVQVSILQNFFVRDLRIFVLSSSVC